MAAARRLADLVSDEQLATGNLYPPLRNIREVSAQIAVAVAEMAYAQGLARAPRPDDLEARIRATMYSPVY